MKKLLSAFLAILLNISIVYASEGGYEYKGSSGMYDFSAEMVVLKKIESQTDPATEKVLINGMALKFEYFENRFTIIEGYQVASVHFSDKGYTYVFDYYVDGDKVVKIVLYTKNGKMVMKQVYPKKKEASSEENK